MAYETRELRAVINGDTSGFNKAVSSTNTMLGNLSKGISTAFSSTLKAVQSGLNQTSIALGVAGAGLTAFEKTSLDYTTNLVNNTRALQRQIGGTVEGSSRLSYVLQRFGMDAADAGTSFNIFTKHIADANGPLKDYHIATKNADGSQRSFNDILLTTADKFKSMPDGIDKTKMALDLFGKSGGDMVKVLNLGSDGIKDLETQADKLGLTLTEASVGSIAAYIKSQKDLQDSTNSLKVKVGLLTAPVLTNFNNTVLAMAQTVMQANTPLGKMVTYVAAFGGPVATAGSALTGFLANIFSVSKGLGVFLTSALGLTTALVGGGGLVFAFGKMLGVDFSPLQASLGNLFNTIVNGANSGITHIEGMATSPGWAKIHEASQKFVDGLTDISNKIAGLISDGKFGKWLGDVAMGIYDVATKVGAYLGPKFGELLKTVKEDLIPTLGQLYEDIIKPLAGAIGTLLVLAIGQLITFINELIKVATKAYDSIKDGLGRLHETLKPVIDWFNVNLMPVIKEIARFVGGELKSAWDEFKRAIDTINQTLKDAGINFDVMKIVLLFLLGLFVALAAPILLVAGVIVGLTVAVAELIRFFSWLTTTIINFGRDAFEGILSNVEKIIVTIGRIGQTARNIAGEIWNAIKGAWDRVMGIDWGAVMVGVGKGIGNSIINLINGAIRAAFSGIPILKDHIPQLPHFAAGGIIPGSPAQGDNVLVAASAGEMILNRSQQQNLMSILNGGSQQQQSSSPINLEVNIGMYAGMPVEKREIALQIWRELVRAARAQGVNLPMIGAVGVQ